MNSLVTNTGYYRSLDVPFNLPQTTLKPDTAEQVALITISPGQQLQLRWLSIHLIKLNIASIAIPEKKNTALSTVYAGLVGDRAQFLGAPPGRPLVYVPVELPGVNHSSPSLVTDLSPGTYALLAVNNLLATEVEVSVCGSFRIILP